VTSIASAQDSEIAGRSPGPARWGRCAWYTAPGLIELHHETLPLPRADEILVRSLYSGISRGTERLVMSGNVAQSEYDRMRCPMQAGDFPFPIKYGYCAVGRVDEGAPELKGRTIFVLHPHQDFFIAPAASAFAGRSPIAKIAIKENIAAGKLINLGLWSHCPGQRGDRRKFKPHFARTDY